MSKIYEETKQKLLEIRKEGLDKNIKCYVLTEDFNIYAITKVSKKNAYYEENGEEIMLEKSIVDIYESPEEVAESITKNKLYYEGKVQRLFGILHKLVELENKYKGELK